MSKIGNMELEFTNKDKADFIYDFKVLANNKVKRLLTNKKIREKNKKILIDFIGSIQKEGLSLATINKYLDRIRNIGIFLDKDIETLTREDVEVFLDKLAKRYTNPDTISSHIFTFRKLIYWYTRDEDNSIVNWIKVKNYMRRSNKKDDSDKYDNIITPREVELMIDKSDNPRDKALVGVLFYSACRLSGIVDLKIKDVVFDDNITWLKVYEGKSGFRKVPVTEITKLLQNWIACHKDKNNPDAYLWLQEKVTNNLRNLEQYKNKEVEKGFTNNHISWRRVADIVGQLARDSGITKKVNPHNFRHSRITQLALSGLGDDYIKIYAGHSKLSRITNLYKHLSTNELGSAMEKLYGIKSNKEERKDLLTKCYRCEFMNRNTLQICENCGMALSSEFSNKLDKEQVKKIKVSKIIGKLLEEPAFKKAIARLLIDQGMVDYVKDLAEEEK